MVFFSKMKAGSPPPHVAGAEQTSVAGSSKQVPPIEPITAGKSTKKMAVKSGATESRTDQHAANASARRSGGADATSCTGQSTSAPSVGASLATEGSKRSAVRITRSSGIKKSSPKVKKGKTANKNKVADEQLKSKEVPSNGRALPPRHSNKGEKAVNGKRAAKKTTTPRPKPKQTAKKNVEVHNDEVREAPEKNASEEIVPGACADGHGKPSKPGGVLKGCKSDDNDRNDAMENGMKAVGPTAGSQLWSVASGDMSQVKSYLSESYRSFEGGALKMKEDLVHDSKTGLQDIGRSASAWGETKKVELTENVIPMLFADGKMFITQGLGTITAGCGAMVNTVANAEDGPVDKNEEHVPVEGESANESSTGKQEGKESTDDHQGRFCDCVLFLLPIETRARNTRTSSYNSVHQSFYLVTFSITHRNHRSTTECNYPG